MLSIGGCLRTSLRGLSKPECVVCFCQDRRSCSVLCQEDELSANSSQGSLHLLLVPAGPGLDGKESEASHIRVRGGAMHLGS